MKESDAEVLKAVCFAVLMQGNGGIINKSFAYVLEKHHTSADCFSAYVMLDSGNQAKVREWSEQWNFPLDEILEELNEKL